MSGADWRKVGSGRRQIVHAEDFVVTLTDFSKSRVVSRIGWF
jgi:hypothetical protein